MCMLIHPLTNKLRMILPSRRGWFISLASLLVVFTLSSLLAGEQPSKALRIVDVDVLSPEERMQAKEMVSRDIERRRRAAIQRENLAWEKVTTVDQWELFRDRRLAALRTALGSPLSSPPNLHVRKTGEVQGEGYRIENLLLESRPGLYVSANLYLPAKRGESMPAVLFSHSHHRPKVQDELQSMGISWARQGWVVLVPDMLGHGERRQHPFTTLEQHPAPYKLWRQDYYFRYNTGIHLNLVGESLMGWMVNDLQRCVDLLVATPGVDPKRVILIGSVAGGGDPAGVAAALDSRIAAVAPFNFGGPQPDYGIPDDANAFYYFGVAYWETTRCLRLGGRDGFAHWAIVGSVAPRRLIYSHEFGWEREHDPVWPRLEKVFQLTGSPEHLAVAAGRGTIKGRPPQNTHCNNVGEYHRGQFYPHLQRWFNMQPPTKDHFQTRDDARQLEPRLMCFTPDAVKQLSPQSVIQLAAAAADKRQADVQAKLRPLSAVARKKMLRVKWQSLLGDVEPSAMPRVLRTEKSATEGLIVERVLCEVEPGIQLPLVGIYSSQVDRGKAPAAILLASAGKQRLLQSRSSEIGRLVAGGVIVWLPDVRGTGESSAGSGDDFRSVGVTLSCRDQVLGQTQLGSRLRDLRSVLRYVRSQTSGDIAIWGLSLATFNPADRDEVVPHGVDNPNQFARPTGGLLALLAGLYEDDISAVCADGSLVSYRSLLDSQFLYVPHDAIVPGALTVGDLPELASAVAPTPLCLVRLATGLNRVAPKGQVQTVYESAASAYQAADAGPQFLLPEDMRFDPTSWILSKVSP